MGRGQEGLGRKRGEHAIIMCEMRRGRCATWEGTILQQRFMYAESCLQHYILMFFPVQEQIQAGTGKDTVI